jgi:uncharacterized protein YbjT (DUF2867 family)
MSVGPVGQEEAMASPMLVTGGTGTLGRQVVPRLRHAGYRVRVLSRPAHRGAEGGNKGGEGMEPVPGDLATGEGLEAAVAGTEIVLQLAGGANGDEVKAAHLVRAAAQAGVVQLTYRHLVGSAAR